MAGSAAADQPFAVVPAGVERAGSPIVGVEAMHEALTGWLAESRAGCGTVDQHAPDMSVDQS